jgi:2-keto-4-pentenoate hydratase
MNHEIKFQTIADEIKAIQDHCKLIVPLTSRLSHFSNGKAYTVAKLIYELRIKEGAVPFGRKIGFTNSKMWSIYRVCEPA